MRNYLIGALVGALVASAVGGFAYAATTVPTSTNTINACYSNSSGALRVATTPCDGSTETPLSWQSSAFRIHKSIVAGTTAVIFSKYGLQLQLECISDPNVTGEYDAWLEAKTGQTGAAKLTGIYANLGTFEHPDVDLTTSYQGLFRATGYIGDPTDAVVDADFIYTRGGQVVSIPLRVIANGGNNACTADGTATST